MAKFRIRDKNGEFVQLMSELDVLKFLQSVIYFTVGGKKYLAKKGMTWEEFLGSDYDTDGFLYLSGGYLNVDDDSPYTYSILVPPGYAETYVYPTDEIVEGDYVVYHGNTKFVE